MATIEELINEIIPYICYCIATKNRAFTKFLLSQFQQSITFS
jgi:hypothetical protein